MTIVLKTRADVLNAVKSYLEEVETLLQHYPEYRSDIKAEIRLYVYGLWDIPLGVDKYPVRTHGGGNMR